MTNNATCRAFLIAFCIGLLCLTARFCHAQAITREQIDAVRAKNLIRDDREVATIKAFVTEQFDEMIAAANSDDLIEPLNNLLATVTGTSKHEQAKVKYSETFSGAVEACYGKLLDRADEQSSEKLSRQMKINAAMIVVASNNIRLIDDLYGLLANPSPAVRYWALRGLTMPEPAKYFREANGEMRYISETIEALQNILAKEDTPAVMAELAGVAALLVKADGAIDVLAGCVDKRLDKYRNWSVDRESCDFDIIRHLLAAVEQFDDNDEGRTAASRLVRKAAELFTATYDRYGKGTMYVPQGQSESMVLLSQSSQRDLRIVLIEGEAAFLRVTQEPRSGRFLSAMQKNKANDISKAYDSLLGKNGLVNRAFAIYPGEENDIPTLPDPPARIIDRAKIMQKIKANTIGGAL